VDGLDAGVLIALLLVAVPMFYVNEEMLAQQDAILRCVESLYSGYTRLMHFGVSRYITKVLGITPLNFKDETITDMFVVSLSSLLLDAHPFYRLASALSRPRIEYTELTVWQSPSRISTACTSPRASPPTTFVHRRVHSVRDNGSRLVYTGRAVHDASHDDCPQSLRVRGPIWTHREQDPSV
jgi:hypothetical protein